MSCFLQLFCTSVKKHEFTLSYFITNANRKHILGPLNKTVRQDSWQSCSFPGQDHLEFFLNVRFLKINFSSIFPVVPNLLCVVITAFTVPRHLKSCRILFVPFGRFDNFFTMRFLWCFVSSQQTMAFAVTNQTWTQLNFI